MDNARAACRDNKEAYALAFSPALRDMNKMIRNYCDKCPIRGVCFIEGVKLDAYGVWGGTTREFRQNMSFMKKYV
jgi:hypothetical protein